MTNKRKLEILANRLWKEAALKKWGNICVVSGQSAITFHHFVSKSRCNNLRYDVENAVPVSKDTHWTIHFSPDVFKRRAAEDKILMHRGRVWQDYIERNSKIKVKTTIFWLKDCISKLEEVL